MEEAIAKQERILEEALSKQEHHQAAMENVMAQVCVCVCVC